MNSQKRDRPWLIRTYSGHSSARASNELYRSNLAKGQTGLSVAFDLPTQTGYDADHPLARGEVGKVGVPISHIDDMSQLFQDIPLDRMNSNLTINATAAWLLALYVAAAERQGVDASVLQGTGDHEGARSLYEAALASTERTFGPDHVSTLAVRSSLGRLQHDMGDLEGALATLTRVVESEERKLGQSAEAGKAEVGQAPVGGRGLRWPPSA